jgi:outer membrane protein OmpA-like peptidoglycan-associated protein
MRKARLHPALRAVTTLLFIAVASQNSDAQTQPAPQGATLRAIEVKDPGGQILSFRHLSGSTVVDMKGTRIEPRATVQMKVQSRPGFVEIDINRGDIRGLQPARRFGKDFLTYVLWAVSVDGEAMNLGEITFDSTGPVSINVTTPYQTFWLMVTAEPDFAVNDPSPVVVLYSINQDAVITSNKALPVSGSLLYYTYYTRYDTSPAEVEPGMQNELLQARKAVALASQSGILAFPAKAGEEPLPDEERTRQTLAQAQEYLKQAEQAARKGAAADSAQFARTSAQIAENARALALGAVGGLYVRQVERDRDRYRAESEQLRQQIVRLNDELAALKKNSSAEMDQLRARIRQLESELAAANSSGLASAERIKELQARVASLEQDLQHARAENARLRDDREKICGELRGQLASLGQLTEQGGNMVLTLASDILFDFGSFELRPAARENLSKLAVLRMLLFSKADVRYEGHTDRVGDDDYNQWLSEQRALSVYRYFLEESLPRQTELGAREQTQNRLQTVQQLLALKYAPAGRNAARTETLTLLGDSVIGKGEREPVEDVPGQSERNRRVVLLFPPAQVGQVTSLCEAPR